MFSAQRMNDQKTTHIEWFLVRLKCRVEREIVTDKYIWTILGSTRTYTRNEIQIIFFGFTNVRYYTRVSHTCWYSTKLRIVLEFGVKMADIETEEKKTLETHRHTRMQTHMRWLTVMVSCATKQNPTHSLACALATTHHTHTHKTSKRTIDERQYHFLCVLCVLCKWLIIVVVARMTHMDTHTRSLLQMYTYTYTRTHI